MNKARYSLLALLLLITNALIAMEQEADNFSLAEVLKEAKKEKAPLSLNRKVQFAQAMDLSDEFKALVTAEQPQRITMSLTAIAQIAQKVEQRASLTTEEYIESWAPRTGAATAACGLLSCLKPYLCGLLDSVPAEEITVALSSLWMGRLYEKKLARIGINNKAVVAEIALAKANAIVEKKIKALETKAQAQEEEEEDKRLDANLDETLEDTEREEREKLANQAADLAKKNPVLTEKEKKNQ